MNIAILGHGVVGSGVAEMLTASRDLVEKACGKPVSLKKILDLRDFKGLSYSNLFTKSFDDIIGDSDIDIVVEAMGGLNPAYDFARATLEAKKTYITSNKELVAQKGAELLAIAKKNNVNFLFEASVGGAIPIIHSLMDYLSANRISEIMGILNGTTNFILKKMIDDKMAFDDALHLAQELGYAEKDPTADIEGIDACRKIAILSSIMGGNHVYPDDIYCEGITKLTDIDIRDAESLGYSVKLIARAEKVKFDKISAAVTPAFIAKTNPLASVDDSFNAVLIKCDAADDIFLRGRGAGKMPTASAVVSDIITAAKNDSFIPQIYWEDNGNSGILGFSDHSVKAYIRIKGNESAPCKAKLIFPNNRELYSENGTFAFIAEELTEGELSAKLESLKENNIKIESLIRILN